MTIAGDRADDSPDCKLNDLLGEAANAINDGADNADELILRVMEAIAQRMEVAEPDPCSELIAQAEQAEVVHDWDRARAYYEQGIQQAIAENDAWNHVRLLNKMSHLCHVQGGEAEAYQWSCRSVEVARGPGSPLLEGALERLAHCALRMGMANEVCAAADEGLALLRDSLLISSTGVDLLLLRAQARLLTSDAMAAKADLDEAWLQLQRQQFLRCAPGIQWRTGQWWRVKALVSDQTSDWNETSHAWQQALDAFRAAASFWETVGWIGEAAEAGNRAAIGAMLREYADAAERAGEFVLAEELRSQC